MAEFLALSAKVSDKTASDEERTRWRELRALLLPSAPKPPEPGQKPRAHPRKSRKLRVSFAAVTDMTVTFTDEVGGGGLRLRSQKHLEPGTELVLRVDLAGEPSAAPLTVAGRVVWSRREGGHFAIGVEFVDLPPGEAERLEALLHGSGHP
jgi:Tfp pilus assembly protein PilZ